MNFESFVRQNAKRYPGLVEKLGRDKSRRKVAEREKRKAALWKHGVRTKGPPI